MSKDNKKGLVPMLRFPEFEKDGEWVKKTLGHLLQFQTGFPFDSKGFNEDYNGIRLIKNRDLKSDDKIVFFSNPFDEKYLVNNDDILIGMDGDFTPCVWQKGKALLNQRVGRIIAQKKEQERFFYYFLIIHLKSIEDRTARTTVKHLSHFDVEKIFKPLPQVNEQQKIASCLSSLDDVITAESQKLEVLKEHKKGLLQNLFPQEGETVPKFRFKEFEDSGEWAEKELGEIADFLKGKGISKADVVDDGIQPCIRYGELYTHYGEVITEIKSFTNQYEELMLSESNDVIIPSSGETKEDIATASCVKLDGVALGGDLNILRSQLNGAFLAYYLSHGLKRAISKIAQGDAVVHLYASQLKKLSIKIPLRDNEQEKIADTISSVDELIHAQTQKIEQLKEHKKGLLQGLFPSPEGAPYHNDVAQPIERAQPSAPSPEGAPYHNEAAQPIE